MTDYYDLNPETYHNRTFHVDPESFLTPLVEVLSPGARILDVGCASGRDLLWLKKRGFDVIGLERAPALAHRARQNTGCRVIQDDFRHFDFSSLLMDAVLLIGALVHIPHDQFTPVLKNILQAVPKGCLLISMKQGRGVISDQQGRVFYLWRDADLRKAFETLGLTVIRYFEQTSAISDDSWWLGYVLKHAKGK